MRPTANGRPFKHRIADGVQCDGIDKEGRTIPVDAHPLLQTQAMHTLPGIMSPENARLHAGEARIGGKMNIKILRHNGRDCNRASHAAAIPGWAPAPTWHIVVTCEGASPSRTR